MGENKFVSRSGFSLAKHAEIKLAAMAGQERLYSLRKKSSGRHSERSEESLLILNESLREILRAKSGLRMTVFRLFPQPIYHVIAIKFQIQLEAGNTQSSRLQGGVP